MTAEVSIIIPTYGRPDNLRRAIISVINQSYKNWELIVVDDNNPDTKYRTLTENVMDKFIDSDKRIIYVKHECNKNGAAARNTGLSYATGKYISFLDDDDEYCKSRIETLYDYLEKNENRKFGGAFTGCYFKKNGKVFRKLRKIKSGNYLLKTLSCTFQMGSGSNIFIRREVLDLLVGFDESFIRHQDYEFMVRFFERYDLLGIPEMLFIRNQTNTNVPSVEKMIRVKDLYLQKYSYIIEKLDKTFKDYILQMNYIQIAEAALKVGWFELSNNYYKNAKKHGGIPIKYKIRRFALKIKSPKKI
jgi:glycosyltransferase involved in cell wall biosynthesis